MNITIKRLLLLIVGGGMVVIGGRAGKMEGEGRQSATADPWSTYLPDLGTFSSPRTADFNQDGILDLVIGAGRQEFMASDSAVIAIDGANGAVLWHVAARDQMFGSALLFDVNDDGVADVFIGGRTAELQAIDGASGEVLWAFMPEGDSLSAREIGYFNFYNPQRIPDQDGDGIDDLLTANGGDVMAAPFHPDRPPGHLMVVSGLTGELLAQAAMPDSAETYMSPVVGTLAEGEPLTVIFGTGGETLGGHLYSVFLDALMKQDLSSARVLASSADKGFIGPPVLVDLNKDGWRDVVANAVDGRMIAIDGKTNEVMWEIVLEGTEVYTSPAVGYFTDDDVPDLFSIFSIGYWPNLGWSRQVMVDGATGQQVFTDSLGLYQTSSAVVVDINQDGIDEALISINYQVQRNALQKSYYTMLVAIDFTSGEALQFGEAFPGSNLSSTPWAGDLNADGLLDVVYVHPTDSLSTYSFDGIQMERIVTQIPIRKPLAWGGYMGSRGDGVFGGGVNGQ